MGFNFFLTILIVYMNISLYSDIGDGSRDENQDSYYITNKNSKNNVYAIFDGHGKSGELVSKFISTQLSHILENEEFPLKKKRIKNIYKTIDSELKSKKLGKYSGTTALCIVQNKNVFNILNSGDCRAVLSHDGLPIQLTRDHKPVSVNERLRIKRLGGHISKPTHDDVDYRIKGLSVSRGFGDFFAKKFVTYVPEVFEYHPHVKDEFIILGSDGIWDSLRNEVAVNLVRECLYIKKMKRMKIAKVVAKTAIDMGSQDNVTVIIIFLK